jgi:hypothetical protein
VIRLATSLPPSAPIFSLQVVECRETIGWALQAHPSLLCVSMDTTRFISVRLGIVAGRGGAEAKKRGFEYSPVNHSSFCFFLTSNCLFLFQPHSFWTKLLSAKLLCIVSAHALINYRREDGHLKVSMVCLILSNSDLRSSKQWNKGYLWNKRA